MLPPSTGLAVLGVAVDVGFDGHGWTLITPRNVSEVTFTRQLSPSSTTSHARVAAPVLGVQSFAAALSFTVGHSVGATCCMVRSPGSAVVSAADDVSTVFPLIFVATDAVSDAVFA